MYLVLKEAYQHPSVTYYGQTIPIGIAWYEARTNQSPTIFTMRMVSIPVQPALFFTACLFYAFLFERKPAFWSRYMGQEINLIWQTNLSQMHGSLSGSSLIRQNRTPMPKRINTPTWKDQRGTAGFFYRTEGTMEDSYFMVLSVQLIRVTRIFTSINNASVRSIWNLGTTSNATENSVVRVW